MYQNFYKIWNSYKMSKRTDELCKRFVWQQQFFSFFRLFANTITMPSFSCLSPQHNVVQSDTNTKHALNKN